MNKMIFQWKTYGLLYFILPFSALGIEKENTEKSIPQNIIRLQHAPILLFSLIDAGKVVINPEWLRPLWNNVNLGVTASFIAFNGVGGVDKLRAWQIGPRVDVLFPSDKVPKNRKTFVDSWYISNALVFGGYQAVYSDDTTSAQKACHREKNNQGYSMTLTITGGYQFFWDSGFSLMLGTGVAAARTLDVTSSYSGTCPMAEMSSWQPDQGDFRSTWVDLMFGYAF